MNKSAFTLVEMVVAITILGMVLVAVMLIYVNTANISFRSDLNRMMQENLKSSVEQISEDIKTNGVKSVTSSTCTSSSVIEGQYMRGERLCTFENQYYLAAQDIFGTWIIRNNTYCRDIKHNCSIMKDGVGAITNNQVSISSMEFYYSELPVQKVTMNLTIQPAIKKGISSALVNETKLIIQTTTSHRPF